MARTPIDHAIPRDEQPRVFLEAVWGALPGDALVSLAAETCYLMGHTWQQTVRMEWLWRDSLGAEHVQWAASMNTASFALPGMGGIYWHGASRKTSVLRRSHARGTLDELEAVGCLWCDLDTTKRGYSVEQGINVLLGMRLKPSIIVSSGGGLQAVHLLNEAWPLPNRETAREFKAHALELYRPAFNASGLTLDESVHDATRMMRLPGFANRKPERRGAVARIVYWQPDRRYGITEIKAAAPLPPPRQQVVVQLPYQAPADGLYRVTREFVAYLVEGEQPAERHPALLRLAMNAARAEMPMDKFLARVRPVAEGWFAGDKQRSGGELDSLTAWAYETVAADPEATPHGRYLVRLTEAGFQVAEDDEIEHAFDQTTEIAGRQPPPIEGMALEALRERQRRTVFDYLAAAIRGMGTYLLLRTSPGTGKTHTAWAAAAWFAAQWRALEETRGGVAFLSLFKLDETNWPFYVAGFGVPAALCYYLVARNGDPTSAGYCAFHEAAEAVGRKGWIVKQTLCSRCPKAVQCEESWYLSQFNRAKTSPILLARHQHGLIDEIMVMRKLIIFDESPLEVVGTPIVLTNDGLQMPPGLAHVQDQYPEDYDRLTELVAALAAILAGNARPKKGERLSEAHVRLGGRWLMERLVAALGEASLEAIFAIPKTVVRDAGRAGLRDVTPEAAADLPINFLAHLWAILAFEYEHHWRADHKRWNSRVIPSGGELRVYPMAPFTYTQGTKVIVTDATGDPDRYAKAFAYEKGDSKRPRLGHVFEPQLTPRAYIVQFLGSDNTRSTLCKGKKKQVALPELDVIALNGCRTPLVKEGDTHALEHAKTLIETLVTKHGSGLLIVCYKEIAGKLRTWVKATAVLPPEQIVWFGSVRGKNDYAHLEACLLIGTPRIPPTETLILAQVWHWNDPVPIDGTPALRVEPYPGHGNGYNYTGYADERVNQMYVHQVRAEMRQCYERIRPNASDAPRYVYIASAFPCTDHVDEFRSWATWQVDEVGAAFYDRAIAQGKAVFESDYIAYVRSQADVSRQTAKRSWDRIHALRVARKAVEPGGRREPKVQQVIAWLHEVPERTRMSGRSIRQQLSKANIQVSLGIVQQAIRIVRGDQ